MSGLLFYGKDLNRTLEAHRKKVVDKISSLDENRLLGSPQEDLVDYFVDESHVEPIELDESKIQVGYGDTQIDVRNRFEFAVFDYSRPTYVQGTRVTIYIPFSGDYQLFHCQPSTFSLNPPRAAVNKSEVIFTYDLTTVDMEGVHSEFERELDSVKKYIGWIKRDVENFNSNIRAIVSERLTSRREKLLRDRELVESLGFPLRRSEGVPATYVAPEVKRKITPRLPPAPTGAYKPEPALAMDHYEHILSVASNMVSVIERSPKAFKGMSEEDLRHHFLVQLNGQYEGQATGETFNYDGKTDILIRADGKNIFIAECKFWTGASGLTDTIDQLLGYTSWRDTKTSILLFNRNRNLTNVLNKIPEVVKSHSLFKRDCEYDPETGFRYIFANRNDECREIVLTILVFDVPR